MQRLPRYWAYLLLSDRGETYAGYTSNLRRRLQQHNSPQNKGWTRGRRWRLIEGECYFDRYSALQVERQLKQRPWGEASLRVLWMQRSRSRLGKLANQLGVANLLHHNS